MNVRKTIFLKDKKKEQKKGTEIKKRNCSGKRVLIKDCEKCFWFIDSTKRCGQ